MALITKDIQLEPKDVGIGASIPSTVKIRRQPDGCADLASAVTAGGIPLLRTGVPDEGSYVGILVSLSLHNCEGCSSAW